MPITNVRCKMFIVLAYSSNDSIRVLKVPHTNTLYQYSGSTLNLLSTKLVDDCLQLTDMFI